MLLQVLADMSTAHPEIVAEALTTAEKIQENPGATFGTPALTGGKGQKPQKKGVTLALTNNKEF